MLAGDLGRRRARVKARAPQGREVAGDADAPGDAVDVEIARDRHEKRRLQPEIIRDWIQSYNFQLKFVIESARDLEEIHDLLATVGSKIKPSKVLLMPEGTDSSAIQARRAMLVDICKRYGYRYCDRLQIELFGNTKGT